MYRDQASAEKAYLKLSAYSPELQFLQLINTARLESIDSSTRDRGGDLGYIKFATFDKSFATAVFHLPLKTLSHPIQSKFGWHLVWVSDALDINSNVPCE
jgi:parvulin-like peptidyl-prolyl isomerase